MRIAVLTFDGFNEIDSFVALNMINRVKQPEMKALITCPSERVTSMNGVVVQSQAPLSFAREADAVIFGSGRGTRDVARTPEIMEQLRLDPARQILGAQCSGTFLLAKLGLLGGLPACTDSLSRPWIEEAGIEILDQPFVAHQNVATAGGCLASHYLAAWVIARLAGWQAAEDVVRYVAPMGQKHEFVERARGVLLPYLAHP
jgi:transcriptional regulator GlxA family with amidase domain